jgi:hypothetical protein
LFERGDHYDLAELHPVFIDPQPVIDRVLADRE